MSAQHAAKKTVWQIWFKPEIVPIYAVVGGAVGLAGWYLNRLAHGTEVVWARKSNPYPWQHVDQDTQVKWMTVNQKFEKTYSRDRL
ncbi:NADH-ubiquinone reductase complex 1 MLRQ subunit-domain-containing protein [Umbelopsis sp. PMI_123]|nr:NADH-ubiquinone reductase complex 1 MLRQ subunit-domain-containing protein [Umbelopsis sp. PMI_123]